MLGPHFYFDLIRLPRKGWSTFFRCLYLSVLLIGLGVMYESQRHTITDLASYASFARSFAYTLIVMQDVLILMLLPVYVASAIAEERENQTIEALFIAPLSNRQIVLGKFGGRLMHLGAVILAGVPLLAFMHMWGNVSIPMLAYHLLNTFLLAMTASSICIFISCRSPVVFQAITTSYPCVFAFGLVAELGAFGLPLFLGENSTAWPDDFKYFGGVVVLVPGHVFLTSIVLDAAMKEVGKLRRLEYKPIRQKTGAFSLTDRREAPVRVRKGSMRGSYVNPLALPIKGRALFWKECLKDGTYWSLTWKWLVFFVLGVAGVCVVCQPFIDTNNVSQNLNDIRVLTSSFGYTAYFIGLLAFVPLVIFQTTMSVAGEREQNTLEFLLLIPSDRREILFCKWLGPIWKNWPILAIAYLGVLLGAGTRVYSPRTALMLLLFPWPFLLMCSGFGMLLSVMCRRTLYANIVVVGVMLVLLVGHFIAQFYFQGIFPAYAWLLFEANPGDFNAFNSLHAGLTFVYVEQGCFLLIAACCGWLAYLVFQRMDYQAKM